MARSTDFLNRLLSPFPGPVDESEEITLEICLSRLQTAASAGVLIYGGPGSGKTMAMNCLAAKLSEAENCVALGPIDLSPFHSLTHTEFVLRELVNGISAEPAWLPAPGEGRSVQELGFEGLIRTLEDGVDRLVSGGASRVVLCLDNFDRVHSWAAVGLADCLRVLYESRKENFGLALSAGNDLEEIVGKHHITSPLRNVVAEYSLKDLDLEGTRALVDLVSPGRTGNALSADDIYAWSRGYPALVVGLLSLPPSGDLNEIDFEEIGSRLLKRNSAIEPFRSALRRIEELAGLGPSATNPVSVLNSLIKGQQPETARGVRTLLAMGIVRWLGGEVAWRNRLVQAFFTKSPGKALVLEWCSRPSSLSSGRVSVSGTIIVTLALDLEELLGEGQQGPLDGRRGGREWIDLLRGLPGKLRAGAFRHWEDMERLASLGVDLELFRQQVVGEALLPVYEARAEDVVLDLLSILSPLGTAVDDAEKSAARDLLESEWRRWQRVRIQLGRDGALLISLVRELYYPLPLVQIQHELLGLERELARSRGVSISVQWELAAAVAASFFQQVAGDEFPNIPLLSCTWNTKRSSPGDPLPALRDRYVTYLFRKACNCRDDRVKEADFAIIPVPSVEELPEDTASEEFLRASEAVSLLEGVMARDPQSTSPQFPSLKRREVVRVLESDLSSWENELFVPTLGSALILYQASRKKALGDSEYSPGDEQCRVCNYAESVRIGDLHFPHRVSPYEDYWKCLSLGLLYIVELRWSAQWITRRCTQDLEILADVLAEPVAGVAASAVADLASSVVACTRLLSHLRDASVPLAVGRAGYGARKYDALIRVSGLRESIQNAEKDIEALNAFLNHYDDQQAQFAGERVASIVGWSACALGTLAVVINLPSLWSQFGDFSSLSEFYYKVGLPLRTGLSWTVVFLVGLAVGSWVFVGRRARRRTGGRSNVGA